MKRDTKKLIRNSLIGALGLIVPAQANGAMTVHTPSYLTDGFKVESELDKYRGEHPLGIQVYENNNVSWSRNIGTGGKPGKFIPNLLYELGPKPLTKLNPRIRRVQGEIKDDAPEENKFVYFIANESDSVDHKTLRKALECPQNYSFSVKDRTNFYPTKEKARDSSELFNSVVKSKNNKENPWIVQSMYSPNSGWRNSLIVDPFTGKVAGEPLEKLSVEECNR